MPTGGCCAICSAIAALSSDAALVLSVFEAVRPAAFLLSSSDADASAGLADVVAVAVDDLGPALVADVAEGTALGPSPAGISSPRSCARARERFEPGTFLLF